MTEEPSVRVEIYLDDAEEPLATYRPPARFQLDTEDMEDGPHVLRIVAVDRSGHRGVRRIPFEVRNGPGIAVDGLRSGETVEGKVSLLVNAYGGAHEENWEVERVETPSPVPTWAWLVFIGVVAWGLYYGLRQWNPPDDFAATPTYAEWGAEAPAEAGPAPEEAGGMGARLYRTSCASCHQENGQGIPGTFPPLAGDPVVLAEDATRHIEIILYGMQGEPIEGQEYQTQMPPWEAQLSNEEVAAVVNHERTSWGNDAPTVTAEDVAQVRARGQGG